MNRGLWAPGCGTIQDVTEPQQAQEDAMASVLSPEAARAAVPHWGHGRLWTGMVLVVVSVVGVVLVLGAADGRSRVWALRTDLAAGSTLSADDLAVVAVRLPDAATYVPEQRDVVGSVLTRDVSAGELVPSGAVAGASAVPRRLVTVPVDRYHLPADLTRGERVDVYLVSRGPTGEPAGEPVLVLEAASVAGVEDDGARFGGSSLETGVVLTVDPQQVPALVSAAARGSLTLVRLPGGAQ
jgi:hypothetical protein